MKTGMNRRQACLGAVGAALTFALLSPALGAVEKTKTERRMLDYTILKDGEPIGSEKVEISRDGARMIVDVTANTRVRMLLLNFTYDHRRQEIWQGGVLESVTAETDDDGTPHKLAMRRDGNGFNLTVDGKSENLPGNAFPLALWTQQAVKSPLLIGVIDGQRYAVTSREIGEETIQAGGRNMKTKHWRIDGDVERDLWVADDGTAVQIAFKRRGYDITYRLKSP